MRNMSKEEKLKVRQALREQKLFEKKRKNAKDLLGLTGWVCQGGTIQIGNAREDVLYEELRKKHKTDANVEMRRKYKVSSPDISFKRKKHEVDIMVINHGTKTVDMYNSKGDGDSGTDSPYDRVKVPVAAKIAVQKDYPDYKVEYTYVRPNGMSNPVFTEHGIPTVATSTLLDGRDINNLVAGHRQRITAKRVEDAIERFCMCEEHALNLRAYFKNPNLYKVED